MLTRALRTCLLTRRRLAIADTTAPTITSANSASNPENSVLAFALTANESVAWSIVGGADQARFELSGSTLRWTGNGTKDFEAPNDANADNAYIVQVRATDPSNNFTNQTITVTVTDVVENDAAIGDELISNRTFATATGWTVAGSASISGGVANLGNVSSIADYIRCTSLKTLVPGTYHLEADDVGATSGDMNVTVGGAPTSGTSNGTKWSIDITIAAVTDQFIQFSDPLSASEAIDNVTCKRTA